MWIALYEMVVVTRPIVSCYVALTSAPLANSTHTLHIIVHVVDVGCWMYNYTVLLQH